MKRAGLMLAILAGGVVGGAGAAQATALQTGNSVATTDGYSVTVDSCNFNNSNTCSSSLGVVSAASSNGILTVTISGGSGDLLTATSGSQDVNFSLEVKTPAGFTISSVAGYALGTVSLTGASTLGSYGFSETPNVAVASGSIVNVGSSSSATDQFQYASYSTQQTTPSQLASLGLASNTTDLIVTKDAHATIYAGTGTVALTSITQQFTEVRVPTPSALSLLLPAVGMLGLVRRRRA